MLAIRLHFVQEEYCVPETKCDDIRIKSLFPIYATLLQENCKDVDIKKVVQWEEKVMQGLEVKNIVSALRTYFFFHLQTDTKTTNRRREARTS